MADTKLSALATLIPTLDDITYVVDDPAGTPVSKRVSLSAEQDLMVGFFGGKTTSIVTAATAVMNTLNIVTGVTSDYVVTLPGATGNTGKHIGFLMGSASELTVIITLDAQGSQTIDGAAGKKMWAEESVVLYCDGSNFHKVAGQSIP